MSYQYLDHTADLGIRAIGATLEQAFDQGAQAMLEAMSDTQGIEPKLACRLTCRAPDIPALFCEWLNELLYQAQVHGALFASAHVTRLERTASEWMLEGTAQGEPLERVRELTTVSDGDLVRNFRMAIQLMRQVRNQVRDDGDLAGRFDAAIRMLDRDEVDARRQLELG